MEVSDIKFWYHQIDLPDGTTTPGISNNKDTMRKLMLPNDMSGIRVLDIGCNQGYFSFECEKRGAIVTSIDTFNPTFGVVAGMLNWDFGSAIDFSILRFDLLMQILNNPQMSGNLILCLLLALYII